MKFFFTLLSLIVSSTNAFCASGGVSLTSTELFRLGSFPITNSMVTSWVISLFIILIVRILVKTPKLIPTKSQLIVESAIGGLRSLTEPIVGKKVFFPSFWLLSGLFIFILIQNWSGLLPGVGTIGNGFFQNGHFNVVDPLIRPGNADLNMTLALALVANLFWVYYILTYAGPKIIIKDWFGNKADKNQVHIVIFSLLGILFIAVGFIEILSIVFRPVSLSFRLFGNVFGGESLLHSMFLLGQNLGLPDIASKVSMFIVPIPFYFMEMLIGLVQALVFMLLVSVYIGLICKHEEDH